MFTKELNGYAIDFTTPPSTRIAEPLVPDEIGLHKNTTNAATSKGFTSYMPRLFTRISIDGTFLIKVSMPFFSLISAATGIS